MMQFFYASRNFSGRIKKEAASMSIDFIPKKISIKNDSQKEKQKHWLNHIKNWKESRLSKAEYCRKAGIKYGKFKWWAYRLKEKEFFLPVCVLGKKLPVEKFCGIEIRGSGVFSIILKGDFEESLLKKALKSLESYDV